MALPLLKACSEGNLPALSDLLLTTNPADIELRDESGSTPLIEAVKNGHVDVIRALLDKGADPSNGSPELHTTDRVILDLLTQAKNKSLLDSVSGPISTYTPDGSDDPQKPYYPPPPPDAYPYYPTINPSLSTVPDGGIYYPPPPPPHMGETHSPGGLPHLPPPEIARMIPCRYYPACRYGPSCIFLHPSQGYYPNGAPPPAHYPPYDPMGAPPFSPNFYPPPTYQQANGPHPMAPLSPPPGPPHIVHARSNSEVVSPTQGPFSPNGVSPSIPYGPMPPSSYPHPAPMPVPLTGPPVPPLHHQTQSQLPPPGPQTPTHFTPSPVGPFIQISPDGPVLYPQQQPSLANGNVSFSPEVDGMPKPQPGVESLNNGAPPHTRDPSLHARRGSRRASFGKPKPPCLFFPTGRCKNGDDCRFPHIMPDGTTTSTNHHTPFYGGRGGGPRQSRGHFLHNGLEEKLNNMNIRDESQTQQNSVEVASKSLNVSDNGPVAHPGQNRPRFPAGGKHHHHHPHHGFNPHYVGKMQKSPVQTTMKQRVPNADEFPVLARNTTPPSKSPQIPNGPTAAQILQAPAPTKRQIPPFMNGKEDSTRGSTPERSQSPLTKGSPSPQDNEIIDDNTSSEPPANKLPVSFAAAATAAKASVASDVAKEVSVSA